MWKFLFLHKTNSWQNICVKNNQLLILLIVSSIVYSEFLLLPFSALAFICLHYGLFAANGQGIIILSVLGEVLEIISQSLFMLLLLLLAMGWAITRQELNCKILLFGLWTTYTILSCLLYVWMKVRNLPKNDYWNADMSHMTEYLWLNDYH